MKPLSGDIIPSMIRKQHMKKTLLLAIVASFVFFTCLPAEAKDLKIGLCLPLTGPYAFAGHLVGNATRMAAKDLGGVVKIAGEPYNITFVEYDTKYTAEGGRAAAERLIFEDKVKFIVGAMTADTQAFQVVTEKNKVIILHQATAIYTSKDKPFSFKSSTMAESKYPALYKAIKEMDPKLKKIAFVNPDTPLGEKFSKFAKAAAETLGFTVAGSEFAAQGASDFTPVLVKLFTNKPDILDLGATGGTSDSALLIKQARELGFTGRIVACIGLQTKTALEVAGPKALEGVMETGFDPKDPVLTQSFRTMAENFIAANPKLPFVDLVGEVYDSTYGLFKFLNGQDTLDTLTIANSFGNFKWEGIYGQSGWGGEKSYGLNRLKVQPIYFSMWKDGKPAIFTKSQLVIP
jgi:branched-chain amino acid transport system substrate-binding protein